MKRFWRKPLEPVNETHEKYACEEQGKLFVSGYYNLKGTWVSGYCRNKNTPFYHITDHENLSSIAKHGIIPHQDNSISAVEMQKGNVINLFLREEDIGFMRNYFHSVMMRNATDGRHISDDFIILKMEVPIKQVQIMHKYKADFVWAISNHVISPSKIEVYDFLFNRDNNVNKIKKEFNDLRSA